MGPAFAVAPRTLSDRRADVAILGGDELGQDDARKLRFEAEEPSSLNTQLKANM